MAPAKKDYPKAAELKRASRLALAWRPNEYLRLTFTGPVAKFPSVTNSRLSMIPKGGLFKVLSMLRARPSRQLVERAIGELTALRAVNIKNPAYIEILTACTALWLEQQPKNFSAFTTDIDDRLFLVLLCDESLRQHDTHNILKATCDWAQDVGIVKNDRHVDAVAVRSSDFFGHHRGTSFLFIRHLSVHNELANLFEEVIRHGKDTDHLGPITRFVSTQQTLGL